MTDRSSSIPLPQLPRSARYMLCRLPDESRVLHPFEFREGRWHALGSNEVYRLASKITTLDGSVVLKDRDEGQPARCPLPVPMPGELPCSVCGKPSGYTGSPVGPQPAHPECAAKPVWSRESDEFGAVNLHRSGRVAVREHGVQGGHSIILDGQRVLYCDSNGRSSFRREILRVAELLAASPKVD